jgi:guanine deaminase
MNDPSTFMRRAIALSDEHMRANHGGPFGAVVVLDGQVVGEGWNQVTSTSDPTAHAEVVAIRDACRRLGRFHLQGAELYTSCEPCPMCLSAAYWARVDRIWFANDRKDAAAIDFSDDDIYEQVALPLEQRSIPMQRLLADEAKRVFQAWSAKQDRTPY